MTPTPADDSRMLTALVQLRGALQEVRLPLEIDGAALRRTTRQSLIDQLEDYVLPRQMSVEAPLLAVVGGSTGAGKSTLVNTLVGRRVTASGLLRPTTRSPVLVHHPDDAHWFGQDRLLPDLVRVAHSTDDPDSLQLVAAEEIPPGLAILDAPDVDSVEERNRVLAAQVLAAADLWLFVTSAARYSDQVPWEHLKRAAARSTSVAVVLDRTPEDAVPTVAAHLARMLASRGLKDSPLFTVADATVSEEGLLPANSVADIRGWLTSLARDTDARTDVVKQTLDGTIRTSSRQSYAIADGAAAQLVALEALRVSATTTYDLASSLAVATVADGSLLRGELLARWLEFAGTGELLRSVDSRAGRLRDRVVSAVKGSTQQADRVSVAVEAALELMVLDRAELAAAQARTAWEGDQGGAELLAETGHDLGRASRDLRRRAEQEVRTWQAELDDLVRAGTPDRRSARFLAYGVRGLGVALSVVVLSDAVDADDEALAGARHGAHLGRSLLDAVFGAEPAGALVAQSRTSLETRVADLVAGERSRWLDVLDGLDLAPDAGERLRTAARRVDDRRFEKAQTAGDAEL